MTFQRITSALFTFFVLATAHTQQHTHQQHTQQHNHHFQRSSHFHTTNHTTNHQRAKDDVSCDKVMPGFELFENGYTLTDLNLLSPLDLGTKKTILKRSCNNNLSVYNEYIGSEFQQPDQVDSIIEIGGSGSTQTSLLITNSEQLSVDLLLTISESFLFGIFSSSESFFATFKSLVQDAVYFGRRYVYESTYKIGLHDSFRTDIMNLSDDFQFMIDQMPNEFNETTAQQFYDAIDDRGTHYLDEAVVGCKMEYQHFTGMGKLDVMASTDIDLNAGFDFLGLLEKSGAVTGTVTAASDTYLNVTRSSMNCYGGGQNCPSDPTSYQAWLKSCPTVPTLITGTFRSVTELIRDPVKANAYQQATWSHMNRAFLEKLLIPASDILIGVAKSPLGFYDSGGNCTRSPQQCPGGSSACEICDGGDTFPSGCGSSCLSSVSSCPNPLFGLEQVTENAQIVQKNLTSWLAGITSLVDQTNTALKFQVVPNATILILGVEFYEYVKNIQTSIQELDCGWTFNQYKTCSNLFAPAVCSSVRSDGCCSGDGKNYSLRTIRYLKGLY